MPHVILKILIIFAFYGVLNRQDFFFVTATNQVTYLSFICHHSLTGVKKKQLTTMNNNMREKNMIATKQICIYIFTWGR